MAGKRRKERLDSGERGSVNGPKAVRTNFSERNMNPARPGWEGQEEKNSGKLRSGKGIALLNSRGREDKEGRGRHQHKDINAPSGLG